METSSVTLEVTVIILLVLANGLFALTEMAIVSSRKPRLEKMANEGSAGAKAALELADDPTQLLSTIQVGITLIGILTGTFGGATLSRVVAAWLNQVPLLAPYSDSISLAFVVAAITYVSLIVGELVPKRVALSNPEPLAAFVARPMRAFSRLATPVVYFLSTSTNLVMRVLGIRPSEELPVTEEEIKILIEQGTEAGAFEKAEQDMVQRVFRFGDLRVYDLMTPRTQMTWLDLEDTPEENIKIITESGYSRFPVVRGNLDEVVGVVYTSDILVSCLAGKPIDLEACIRRPLFVPRSMRAFRALEMFKQQGVHEAVVLDEFGGVLGFVTLHDLLEAIIGDMPLADDAEEPMAVQRDDGSWLVDGMMPVEDFKEMFGIDELPEEERDHFHTVGGFVISYLGHIPAVSEQFAWGRLRIEIIDMDRVRVDKILVTVVDNGAVEQRRDRA